MAVFGNFLHGVAQVQAKVSPHPDHPLVVHRRVAHESNHIPLFQLVVCAGVKGLVHHHAFDVFVNLEKSTQRRVLQRLHLVVQRRLAVVAAIGDIGQKQLNLFIGDDVPDVLRVAQAAVGQTDHPLVCHGRAAAVA